MKKIIYIILVFVGWVALFGWQKTEAKDEGGFSFYLPLITRNYPATPNLFGVDANPIGPKSGIYQVANSGAYWTRSDLISWANVEPTKGARNWDQLSSFENHLKTIHTVNMKAVVIVGLTPEWAQKFTWVKCGPIKESELDAFADFMADLALRYSQPPLKVDYWEIWNEPDIDPSMVNYDSGFGCWGDAADEYYGGGYYAEMLARVYPKIKQANPNAQVLVGGLLLDCDPTQEGMCPTETKKRSARFFEGILRHNGANDGGNYFDGVSIHAYDYYDIGLGQFSNANWGTAWNTQGTSIRPKVNYIQSLLDDPAFGAKGKYIMNTEMAILCGANSDVPGTPPCESTPDSVFEQTKAYYVARSYGVAVALDLKASIWYRALGWRNSNLLNRNLTPRPAYLAYTVAVKQLSGATFVEDIHTDEGLRGFKYTRGNQVLWLAWSANGSPVQAHLDKAPTAIYDVYGNSILVSDPVIFNIQPYYLEFSR